MGPEGARHSAETKQKAKRKGQETQPLPACGEEQPLRGGLVSEPLAVFHGMLGRFLVVISPSQESVFLEVTAWGFEAPDPYGNEQRKNKNFTAKAVTKGAAMGLLWPPK